MVMLGDILAEARRSSDAFGLWLRGAMPELLARIGHAADEAGEGTAHYVQGAVAEFSQAASEEDWAQLTSRMRDSSDPGTACLLTMVRWRLARDDLAMKAVQSAEQGAEHDASR